MDEQNIETFVLTFMGKQFKCRIPPELKPKLQELQGYARRLEELEAMHGPLELTDDVLAELQPDIETLVAAFGLDCAMAEYLKVRA